MYRASKLRYPVPGILFMFVMVLLFLFPLWTLVRLSGSARSWFSGLSLVWREQGFLASLITSLHLALVSMFITAVVGTIVAIAFRLFPIPGRQFLLRAMELIVAFPSFLVAFSLIYLYGSRGAVTVGIQQLLHLQQAPFDFLYSQTGIVMAEVTYYLPFMIRPLLSAIELLDGSLFEAASSLGAGRLRQIWRVLLPLSLPGITAGAILCFLFILNEFGILLILGSQRTPTVPVSIYNRAMVNLDLPGASQEALLMLVFVLVIYLVYRFSYSRAERRFSEKLQRLSLDSAPLISKGRSARILGTATTLLVAIAFFLPVAVVLLSSFAKNWVGTVLPTSFTLHWFTSLQWDDWGSIITTLIISTIVSAIAAAVGLLGAWLVANRQGGEGGLYDTVLTLPQTVPSVVIGLSLLMAYDSGRLNFSNSPIIVILAQTTLVLPTSYRTIVVALTKLPQSYSEAAQGLGASPMRAFVRVTLPLLVPALKSAFGLAFALSAGELGATMMVYPPGFATAPIQIVQYVQRGYYAQGAALSIVMLCVLMIVLTLTAGEFRIPFFRRRTRLAERVESPRKSSYNYEALTGKEV
ncbi:ABC transporter permease [Alicyclobacillus dauci]|uniref:Iron ABC transporter permease n=1 Tax=Alicyclobacillus dauci TaxID=1475485 RepID=A0ABY6YZV6_9BACL|nr:iron ABC transporter permease [Alicyclobacillus dauci]WAH36122.1 iron ABC transporter permease [Alicyclobacillus dauci]